MSNTRMYKVHSKWCFVPLCRSTSVSTPNKIFVRVPRGDYERKKRWFTAARRDMPKSKSEFFCCEDHFNLEEDMENYLRFKMMGGKILMKREAVPHIFDCQPDRKRTASHVPARSLPIKRQRKRLVLDAQAEEEQRFVDQPLYTPLTSTAQTLEVNENLGENNSFHTMSVKKEDDLDDVFIESKTFSSSMLEVKPEKNTFEIEHSLNKSFDKSSDFSSEQNLQAVKIENTLDNYEIEKPDEAAFEEWKIKNEEVYIKEEIETRSLLI